MNYIYNKPNRYEEQLAYEVSSALLPEFIQVRGFGSNVEVQFSGTLTPAQKTQLDLILSNHVADPNWESNASAVARQQEAINQFEVTKGSFGPLIRAVAVSAVMSDNTLRRQVIGGIQVVWNPASMVNGSGVTSPAVTITGAAFGDVVEVAAPYSLQGIMVYGYVDAPDTVRVRLHNGTGSTIDLASGNWRVLVRRPEVLPLLTVDDAKQAVINRINAGD